MMYDRILVPTDGSDPSEYAAAHAVEFADEHDATVHALFVMETDVELPSTDVGPGRKQLEESLREQGRRAVDEVERLAKEAGVDCETHVREGSAADRILDEAEESDVDLVVMGTHGRTGLDRILVGSTTERVLRRSDIPVLTVSQEAEA